MTTFSRDASAARLLLDLTASSVVALVRVVSGLCITLPFLAEMIIGASAMKPAANDLNRVEAIAPRPRPRL